ncbi:uncharacterized protein [Nicotiana tomentosiformis]|uniref:Uncharacterized protein n=1 Tax=Nicotiana tabacum TaxID=4097 RepID=A0A1S3YBJ8_TOBAC|nr:uncharacterized protein LOC104111488 [Nicotiana tomentosiformis]XP_016449585.1 PREDICTED: uncharacterized protein LOC107774545 [Nicotiana tabacum]
MGQAFRRATGRIGSSNVDAASSQLKKPIDRRSPPAPAAIKTPADNVAPVADSSPKVAVGKTLEERDPKFDAMLGQMVGRIRAKPGGKLEMGEASVVEKYDRALPKLRNTTSESSRYEERPAPPGTLNVAQIREIILLHQGRADYHKGPMDINQIAQRFRVDAAQVQRILQFVSLPPEDTSKKRST